MTPLEQANALLKAAEEATPGEWHAWASYTEAEGYRGIHKWAHACGPAQPGVLIDDQAGLANQRDQAMRDAHFIALARNTAPAIASALLEKQKELEEADARLSRLSALLDEAEAALAMFSIQRFSDNEVLMRIDLPDKRSVQFRGGDGFFGNAVFFEATRLAASVAAKIAKEKSE